MGGTQCCCTVIDVLVVVVVVMVMVRVNTAIKNVWRTGSAEAIY